MNRHVILLVQELGRRPRDLREVSRLAAKASVRRFLADHGVEREDAHCAVAITCVRRGDFHALSVLLQQGANANIVVRDSCTTSHRSILHEAVRQVCSGFHDLTQVSMPCNHTSRVGSVESRIVALRAASMFLTFA
jgi:hypothetical protein